MSHTLPPNDVDADVEMAHVDATHPPQPHARPPPPAGVRPPLAEEASQERNPSHHVLATPPSSPHDDPTPVRRRLYDEEPPPKSMFSAQPIEADVERLLQRFVPVQNIVAVTPEPDMYPKHREGNVYVHGQSRPLEFLLYLRRSIEHKVRVCALPNISSVMAWVETALDTVSCSRFLEVHWGAVLEEVGRYDNANPTPKAYIAFLRAFVSFFLPKLDESDLFQKYNKLFEGGEITSLEKLYEWIAQLRNASRTIVGTDFWAPRRELDALQNCARVPMELVLSVNAHGTPSSFDAWLLRLELVVRDRMRISARRRGQAVNQVQFQEEAPSDDKESLVQQVAQLTARLAQLTPQEPPDKKRWKDKQRKKEGGGEGGGSGSVTCFACGGPHFVKKCPLVKAAKANSSN